MAFLKSAGRATCTAAAALTLCSCELTRDPTMVELTEDRVLLQSVLVAGDSTARVLLSLIPASSDPFNPYGQPEWIPIADAEVRVIAGADTIRLETRPDAASNACISGPLYDSTPAGDLLTGCYVAAMPGGILNERAYELVVDLPVRGRIHGRTVVPAAPSFLQPVADATLPVDTGDSAEPTPIHVQWSGIAASRMAELAVVTLESECTLYLNYSAPFFQRVVDVTGGSSIDTAVGVDCSVVEPGGIGADFVLTSFDSVYTRYVELNHDHNPRLEDAAAGFTGPAIGVFASAASARRSVRFVPE